MYLFALVIHVSCPFTWWIHFDLLALGHALLCRCFAVHNSQCTQTLINFICERTKLCKIVPFFDSVVNSPMKGCNQINHMRSYATYAFNAMRWIAKQLQEETKLNLLILKQKWFFKWMNGLIFRLFFTHLNTHFWSQFLRFSTDWNNYFAVMQVLFNVVFVLIWNISLSFCGAEFSVYWWVKYMDGSMETKNYWCENQNKHWNHAHSIWIAIHFRVPKILLRSFGFYLFWHCGMKPKHP